MADYVCMCKSLPRENSTLAYRIWKSVAQRAVCYIYFYQEPHNLNTACSNAEPRPHPTTTDRRHSTQSHWKRSYWPIVYNKWLDQSHFNSTSVTELIEGVPTAIGIFFSFKMIGQTHPVTNIERKQTSHTNRYRRLLLIVNIQTIFF